MKRPYAIVPKNSRDDLLFSKKEKGEELLYIEEEIEGKSIGKISWRGYRSQLLKLRRAIGDFR